MEKIILLNMIGYHYTSWENYTQIHDTGLTPYKIKDKPFRSYGLHDIKGVWLWANQLVKESHWGTVILQLQKKKTEHVVQLKCEFDFATRLMYKGNGEVHVSHLGQLTNSKGPIFTYHEAEPVYITTVPILPSNIQLIDIYAWKDLPRLMAADGCQKLADLLPHIENMPPLEQEKVEVPTNQWEPEFQYD